MTLEELYDEAKKWIDRGYGDKPIVMPSGDMNVNIDSIQQNNHASKEPDYLLLLEDDEFTTGDKK